ncbi:4Fe-4S dicluster domain-containing protein [Parafrankia elaeagni]|uniref:4Fe-4S dicluster domain-containing protein n=1 Tax=Parafrankia elaeagni TaxID=222534 RepID=UPI00036D6A6F|nr:4Fe-4S dicluster domain-containing protein [Parafrankia elaeagni]
MTAVVPDPVDAGLVVPPAGLDVLIHALRERGYEVVGPTIRDRAIVYGEITDAGQLPVGWTDVQNAASYRLERRADDARFGYAVGPHSWKQFLLPPRLRLMRIRQNRDSDAQNDAQNDVQIEEEPPPAAPLALIGVRSCELNAVAIQDRVLVTGRYPDRDYAVRREGLFIIGVNCHEPGGTCFCVSMDTGPAIRRGSGYDLLLSEILEGEHRFLIEAGTPRGAELLAALNAAELNAAELNDSAGKDTAGDDEDAAGRDTAGRDTAGTATASVTGPGGCAVGRAARPVTSADRAAAEAAVERAAARMGRVVDAGGLRDLLAASLDHPRWDDVAERCLTCGNCTMVCPTCFCVTVEDVGDLAGGEAERWRSWESCFSLDHSYLHGGAVRAAPRSRYRQWLTHKFGTWHDQFGSSGCVGCGRCITWCPVGIDVTEELAAIRTNVAPGDPPR